MRTFDQFIRDTQGILLENTTEVVKNAALSILQDSLSLSGNHKTVLLIMNAIEEGGAELKSATEEAWQLSSQMEEEANNSNIDIDKMYGSKYKAVAYDQKPFNRYHNMLVASYALRAAQRAGEAVLTLNTDYPNAYIRKLREAAYAAGKAKATKKMTESEIGNKDLFGTGHTEINAQIEKMAAQFAAKYQV